MEGDVWALDQRTDSFQGQVVGFDLDREKELRSAQQALVEGNLDDLQGLEGD